MSQYLENEATAGQTDGFTIASTALAQWIGYKTVRRVSPNVTLFQRQYGEDHHDTINIHARGASK